MIIIIIKNENIFESELSKLLYLLLINYTRCGDFIPFYSFVHISTVALSVCFHTQTNIPKSEAFTNINEVTK